MGGFLNVMKNMMNWTPQGSPEWAQVQSAKRGQQQLDLQKEQQFRQNQEADQAFAEHMQSLGARPVINGVVKEDQMMPDIPGIGGGGQTFQTIRKGGEGGRTVVPHKTAEGETVQWELPTMEEQIRRQMLGQQAIAQGRAQGTAAAKQTDLQTRGVRLGDVFDADTIKRYGLNPEYRDLPENIKAMMPADIRGVTSTTNAQTRADASTANAQTRADTAKTVEQMREDAQKQRDDAMNQFKAGQNQTKLDYQDRWQKARAAISGNAQSNINNRTNLRLFDADQKQHSKLLDDAFKEQQKAFAGQALLDTQETTGLLGGKSTEPAVKDGEEFTDPWSGKKMTMNYAQRLRLKNALGESQAQVASLKQRADAIAQKRGLNSLPAGTGGDQTGGGGAAATSATVRVKTGDGRTGTIPKDKLDAAKKADPKLQVITQ